MVSVVGLEPTWYRYRGIFLLLYVAIAALLRCSLDYVFTIGDALRWLVYSLYTFINIRLFFKLHLPFACSDFSIETFKFSVRFMNIQMHLPSST